MQSSHEQFKVPKIRLKRVAKQESKRMGPGGAGNPSANPENGEPPRFMDQQEIEVNSFFDEQSKDQVEEERKL